MTTFRWSDRSKERLYTCRPQLVDVFDRVLGLGVLDLTVIEGRRSDERQIELHRTGMSKLDGVTKRSKHQVTEADPLSKAVDVAPLRGGQIDWQDRELWMFYGGVVKACAASLSIPLRWGGDWNGDLHFNERFFDAPHWELINV